MYEDQGTQRSPTGSTSAYDPPVACPCPCHLEGLECHSCYVVTCGAIRFEH